MWEITTKTQSSGNQPPVVAATEKQLAKIASHALARRLDIEVKTISVDIYVVDPDTGRIDKFKQGVAYCDAIKYVASLAKANSTLGYLLWPHGAPVAQITNSQSQ